jgi:hypothetical protein
MSKIHEAAFDANISTPTQTFGFTFYYRRRNRLPDQLTVLPAFFAASALEPVFNKQPFEWIVRQLISLFCPSGCGACARRLVAPFTGVWIETLAAIIGALRDVAEQTLNHLQCNLSLKPGTRRGA